jgi:hypothetical protein
MKTRASADLEEGVDAGCKRQARRLDLDGGKRRRLEEGGGAGWIWMCMISGKPRAGWIGL